MFVSLSLLNNTLICGKISVQRHSPSALRVGCGNGMGDYSAGTGVQLVLGAAWTKNLFPDQLRFLTARAIELEAGGNGLIVDPLFDVAVVENLASDPLGRADLFTHLFGRHAALKFIKRRSFPAPSQATNPKTQQSEQAHSGEKSESRSKRRCGHSSSPSYSRAAAKKPDISAPGARYHRRGWKPASRRAGSRTEPAGRTCERTPRPSRSARVLGRSYLMAW
jgi:hypothetical protein